MRQALEGPEEGADVEALRDAVRVAAARGRRRGAENMAAEVVVRAEERGRRVGQAQDVVRRDGIMSGARRMRSPRKRTRRVPSGPARALFGRVRIRGRWL